MYHSQMLHVWHIYLHLGHFWGKCRYILPTWSIWDSGNTFHLFGGYMGFTIHINQKDVLQHTQPLDATRESLLGGPEKVARRAAKPTATSTPVATWDDPPAVPVVNT